MGFGGNCFFGKGGGQSRKARVVTPTVSFWAVATVNNLTRQMFCNIVYALCVSKMTYHPHDSMMHASFERVSRRPCCARERCLAFQPLVPLTSTLRELAPAHRSIVQRTCSRMQLLKPGWACLPPHGLLVTLLHSSTVWHMLLWRKAVGHALLTHRTLTWSGLVGDCEAIDA